MEPSGLSAICQGMFKKESDLTAFVGMKVAHSPLVAGHHLLCPWPPPWSVMSNHDTCDQDGMVTGCDYLAAASRLMALGAAGSGLALALLDAASEYVKRTSLHPWRLAHQARETRPCLASDTNNCVAEGALKGTTTLHLCPVT